MSSCTNGMLPLKPSSNSRLNSTARLRLVARQPRVSLFLCNQSVIRWEAPEEEMTQIGS